MNVHKYKRVIIICHVSSLPLIIYFLGFSIYFLFISMYFQMLRFVDGNMLTEVFSRLQWFPVCLTNRKLELQNFRGPFLRKLGVWAAPRRNTYVYILELVI